MSSTTSSIKTYTNPLHTADTPDPFVLKHCGVYWCYCTGWTVDDMCFPMLMSSDLVTWTEQGGAMPPLPGDFTEYWAPEVSYWEGRFYLYYSVGDGTLMHIRVATAEQPFGPFRDSGVRLTAEEFAIDPHVFESDGERWLFYATDFLTHSHVGTGTVKDRLLDPYTLEGTPAPVVRARYDWHLFDPRRAEKGHVRWHTVEGPTVLRRKDIYYEMFSGGNWKTDSYGVGYAVSESLDAGAEWTQACDGVSVLPILRTTADVVGPGHNSVVRGPDNRRLYCVYHRWDHEARRRQLAIDPIEWIGEELCVFGPTHTPQPAPNLPAVQWPAGPYSIPDAESGWTIGPGNWSFRADALHQTSPEGYCEVWRSGGIDTGFVIECDVEAHSSTRDGTIGLYISDGAGQRFCLSLSAGGHWRLSFDDPLHADAGKQRESTSSVFSGSRFIRLTGSGRTLYIVTENSARPRRVVLNNPPQSLGLFTHHLAGTFRSFALTRGWNDTFEHGDDNLADLGFETRDDGWTIASMELRHETSAPSGTIMKRAPAGGASEFVVNVRLESVREGSYGFFPAAGIEKPGPLVVLRRASEGYALCVDHSGGARLDHAPTLVVLPSTFDAGRYQQFGITMDDDHMQVRWRDTPLCRAPLERAGSRIGLYARGRVAFDMVRVTELTYGDR